MARVVLVETSPWDPATGAAVPVRLAGGGRRHFIHKGHGDWLAGIASLPKVTSAIGFDQSGFTGGAIPQAAGLGFAPSQAATVGMLARLMWNGAAVTISTGDDDDANPAWTIGLAGTMAGYSIGDNRFAFTMSDLAGALAKPIAASTFAGNGGLEGSKDATGRIKRRSFGECWNVECRLLDKANNIYEVGDPARPIQAIDVVKDRGRIGPAGIVAWQGSADATLAALIAAEAPDGGSALAPSIACLKWWTQPSGPLTADIRGEVGAGYVSTVPDIAARISAAAGGPAVDGVAALVAARPGAAGLHVDSDYETAAQALDRLLLGASLVWAVDPAGMIVIRPISFDNPIEAITAAAVDREAAFAPISSVAVAYRHNQRVHSDAEISAAVLAGDVTFDDGQTLADLKPAEPGATKGAPAGTEVAGRPAEDLLADVDLGALSLLAYSFNGVQLKDYVNTKLFVDGQPVNTVISTEITQRIEGQSALAQQLSLIGATNGTGTGFVLSLTSVQIGGGETLGGRLGNINQAISALSVGAVTVEQFNQLSAQLDSASASISTLQQVIVLPNGGAYAQAILQLDVNGYVTGYRATNDGTRGSIVFTFDHFAIKRPDGTNLFTVDGETNTVKMTNVEVDKIKAGAIDFAFNGANQSLNPAGGFQILPGGFIIQWGQYRAAINTEQAVHIDFPMAFPSALMSVTAIPYITSANSFHDLWMQSTSGRDKTGATFFAQAATSDNRSLDGFDWMAFGK